MATGCENCGLACRFILLLFAAIGLTFSILTIASCEYFEYESGFTFLPGAVTEGTIGLFRGDILGECETYPDDADFDGYMIAARTLSVLATFAGIVGICFLVCECVLCKCCGSKILLNLTFFIAYACQGGTFVIFATERFCLETGSDCSLGNGAIYSIVAIAMWMITSCVVCCAPKPEPLIKGCCKKKEKDDKKAKDEEEPAAKEEQAAKEEDKPVEEEEPAVQEEEEEPPVYDEEEAVVEESNDKQTAKEEGQEVSMFSSF